MENTPLDNQNTPLDLAKEDEILLKTHPVKTFWEITVFASFCLLLLVSMLLKKEQFLIDYLTISPILLTIGIAVWVKQNRKNNTKYYLLKKGIYLTVKNGFLKEENIYIPYKRIQKFEFLSKRGNLVDVLIHLVLNENTLKEIPTTYKFSNGRREYPLRLASIPKTTKIENILNSIP